MPGFDGTGPRGKGPMTGGGFGYCATGAGAYPAGAARGFGRGRGGGGMGFGRYRRAAPVEVAAPGDEESVLESRLKLIEEEAARIKRRLGELES